MEKKDIRREVRSRLAALPESGRMEASAKIFGRMAEDEGFRSAGVVAAFASLPDEPSTAGFLREWGGHKRIVLPRVEGDGTMNFYDYAPGSMNGGAYGISEPRPMSLCRPEEIDFMIVPGVAFTSEGKRLGRGKGFYDRYMSLPGFRARTAGVCFSVQIVDDLPTEKHDLLVDTVLHA